MLTAVHPTNVDSWKNSFSLAIQLRGAKIREDSNNALIPRGFSIQNQSAKVRRLAKILAATDEARKRNRRQRLTRNCYFQRPRPDSRHLCDHLHLGTRGFRENSSVLLRGSGDTTDLLV
jgi:hypothetical protein